MHFARHFNTISMDFSGIIHRQRVCFRLKEEGLEVLCRVKTFKNPDYWQKSACPPDWEIKSGVSVL